MPKKRSVPPFFLIIVDHETKVFNIVGPMIDDTDWTDKVVEFQKAGRKVNCHSTSSGESVGSIAKKYSKQTGYTFSKTLMIDEPEDNSSEYKGALPIYAQGADRKKTVKILCKGRCGQVRWAEMKTNYPGQVVLRNSNFGDYSATCLKCGREAKDCYNWVR